MAFIANELPTNEHMKKLHELAAKERQLVAELDKVRAIRKDTVNAIRKEADSLLHSAEQFDLALDYEAGDESVVLDGAAGNGAGYYRRVVSSNDAGTIRVGGTIIGDRVDARISADKITAVNGTTKQDW